MLMSYDYTTLASAFFYSCTAPSCISTLSLHDALPISGVNQLVHDIRDQVYGNHEDSEENGCSHNQRIITVRDAIDKFRAEAADGDRKSTRLNSSHVSISYAVFCFKQKNN